MGDEVRRSSRLTKGGELKHTQHIQLDNEPRRKKGATQKSLSFSTVEELKTAIVIRKLDSEMEDVEVEKIQEDTLRDLGISFCGIPPEELSDAGFEPQPKK